MEFQNMNIQLNKNKAIGKVLYIVEGAKTEAYILHRIFCNILDYQLETLLRDKGYNKYNSKTNFHSQVFVINAEESNIKYISKDNKFLNNIFKELIQNYDFDIDNAAIYYLFDRDNKSNNDKKFVYDNLKLLVNSRDSNGYDRQGMLLLSYPSVESFTLSNFVDNSFEISFEIGKHLKQYLHEQKINQSNIDEKTLLFSAGEMLKAFSKMSINNFDIDMFGNYNEIIFRFEENEYDLNSMYRALSLICVSLIDLGIIDIVNSTNNR